MQLGAVTSVLATVLSLRAASPSSSDPLALSPDGRILFVVNPDSNSVSAVDTDRGQKVAEAAVGEDPRSLALSPDGQHLYVTNQRSATLAVVNAQTLEIEHAIAVDAEPYGVVADPKGDFAYVASAAASCIDVIRTESFPRNAHESAELIRRPPVRSSIVRIPVGPKPKGLAISADGSRLYVTHFLTGDVSVIDTATRQVLQVIATGNDSNMAQKIVLHPSNARAYMPHIRSNVTNRSLLFDSTIFPVVSVIDLASSEALPAARVDLSLGNHSVNLPFDLAFSPDGQRAYVVNLGSGEMSVVDVTLRRRIADVDVGDGPRGIAVASDGSRAYISNSLSNDVSVVDLTAFREIMRIPVTASPLPPDVQRGKVLFFSSHSPQISTDRWMSCASCHFEGEIDGRTWLFAGSGPRNTVTIRGTSETRPLHWSADRDEFQDFEFTIRQLQAGTGLIAGRDPNPPLGPPNAGLSADLDALAAYCASVAAKPSPVVLDPASVQRGTAIFQRADVGCANCHNPPYYTDSSLNNSPFLKHDVGTGDGPDEQNGSAFDTPSLRMLWDTAPYLHDGSAATLWDVLVTKNPLDLHGRTSQLSEAEIQDLIAFLLSL